MMKTYGSLSLIEIFAKANLHFPRSAASRAPCSYTYDDVDDDALCLNTLSVTNNNDSNKNNILFKFRLPFYSSALFTRVFYLMILLLDYFLSFIQFLFFSLSF